METKKIKLPDIAIQYPIIQQLFDPDRVDKEILAYQNTLIRKRMPWMIKHWEKGLATFLDWKKVLQEEITLEEYNNKHQLTDLK